MKVAVLGAGAAGLAAAGALRRSGTEVLVFESDTRVGGKIRTVAADGFLCEDGPNSLTAASGTALRLLREANLTLQEARAPHTRFVVRGGQMLAAPSRRLLSASGWARVLGEPLAGVWTRPAGEESLREFLERHLGREAGDLASTLLANGVYGGDPRRLSARDAIPRIVSLATGARSLFAGGVKRALAKRKPAEASNPSTLWMPEGGLSTLIDALAEKVWEGLQLGVPAETLRLHAGGLRVGLGGAAPAQVEVDGVVCALPAEQAAGLLSPLAAGAATLAEVRCSALAVVHLGFRVEDFRAVPKGFGVLDGDGSLNLLGALFPSSLFANRAPAHHLLLTCMLGGALHPELVRFDDHTLEYLCCEDLRRLFGVSRPPVFRRIVRWAEAVPQPNLGHRQRIAAARAALAGLPIELAGAAYDGVAVDQVLVSGEAAAERLADRLHAVPRRTTFAAPQRVEA